MGKNFGNSIPHISMSVLAGLSILALASCGETQEGTAAEATGRIATGSLDDIDNFCALTQQEISSTNLVSTNIVHDVWKNFTASKAFVDEEKLETHQHNYYETLPDSDEQYMKIISCKVKSADRINMFRGDDAAGEQKSCQTIHENTVNKVLSRITLMDPPEVVFDEDDTAMMGPNWLAPWPYDVAYKDEAGALHFRGKGMMISYSKLNPMPDQFLGVHYCHLAAPDYIEALLMGRAEAPKL